MPEAPGPGSPASPIVQRVAIACQGGGARTAFTAGVLDRLLEENGRAATADGEPPVIFEIVGLSGTSGGAICAALAWRALLLGDAESRAALGGFWTSPYPGGNAALDLATPAGWVDAAGLGQRAALGDTAAALTLLDAARAASGRVFQASLGLLANQPVQWTPEAWPYAWPRLFARFDALAGPAVAAATAFAPPAWRALNPLLPDSAMRREFDAQELMRALLHAWFPPEVLARMRTVASRPGAPDLLIGAVDVARTHEGTAHGAPADSLLDADEHKARQTNFVVFRGSRNVDRLIECLLASSALPTLMRAVTIDAAPHWDALYSANPPVRDLPDLFTRDKPELNPEEIWVIRINPLEGHGEPQSFAAIDDRRNELAGNISLLHEIAAVRTMNRVARAVRELNRKKPPAGLDYREVALGFIDLEPFDGHLDHLSKFDRSQPFLCRLFEHGRARAAEFLEDWRMEERAWARANA